MAKRTKSKSVIEGVIKKNKPVAEPVWPKRVRDWLGRWNIALACAAVLIATLRIVARWRSHLEPGR